MEHRLITMTFFNLQFTIFNCLSKEEIVVSMAFKLHDVNEDLLNG